MNLASVWDLPVLFVCENNLYAEFTPQAAQSKVHSIAERAPAYGMVGVSIDGNDALAVYDAAVAAVERARHGAGPTLIEARTYRWRGHHEGDAMLYRPKAEFEAWRANDPIPRFRGWLLGQGMLTEAAEQSLVDAVQAEVDAATEFARESPWPAPEAALEDVYA
jgi:pyruvate dehydrogenase E1 component alpha subunit